MKILLILQKRKNILLIALIIFVLVILFWQLILSNLQLTGHATLSWNASEGDVNSYVIYYGKDKRIGECPQGGYSKRIDVGNRTSYLINDLDNGQTYYFSVTSKNTNGKESCFSPEMSKTIKITMTDKFKSLFK